MKHIRNLWSILKQEISLWKNEKKDLITGILYIGMITWLFYNRIVCMIFLSPFLFLWMRRQRTRREYKKKEILRKEFREMMLSIGNSLSAGYSIENSLKTAKNDLLMYQENSMLAKELHLLINHLKINEPVDKLFLDMAERVDLEEIIYVFLTIFLYLLKCPQSLILSALRAFCFCGKSHIHRSIFLYFRYQSWLKSW